MNKSKQKGTRAETNIVKALQAEGIAAERRALAGSNDKGDIKINIGPDDRIVIIESKAGKQTQAPSRFLLTEWLSQTEKEMYNSGAIYAALVVCSYRRSIKDYPVYLFSQYRNGHPEFMFFDEFIVLLKVMTE